MMMEFGMSSGGGSDWTTRNSNGPWHFNEMIIQALSSLFLDTRRPCFCEQSAIAPFRTSHNYQVPCTLGLPTMAQPSEPIQKRRLLRMTVAHYRQPDVSEEDFHRWVTEQHAARAAKLHAKNGIEGFQIVSNQCINQPNS